MFACLHLPGFTTEAALSLLPTLRSMPCAVMADHSRPDDPKCPILSLNSIAESHGLHPGESVVHALLRCPGLRLLQRAPQAEASIGAELLRIAESITPNFELVQIDTLILDITGCRFPATWQPTLPLRLSLAKTPDLAHFAALTPLPFTNQPIQASDLDPLPLTLLRRPEFLSWETLPDLFHLWGLRTLGDLRRLPRQELADRAGLEALRLHDILNARSVRLLKLHRTLQSFAQSIHFEDSINSSESIVFQLNKMIITLSKELAFHHLAAASIRLKLSFESSPDAFYQIHLPEPRVDPKALLAPLQTLLENLQTPSSVTSIELSLDPVKPSAAQREWIGRQLSQPHRWPDTLARLESLLGHGRIGIPQPTPSHRPDDFELHPLSSPPLLTLDRPPDCDLPLRRFRPPLEVAVASTGHGAATRPLALLTGAHAGRIHRSNGPFPSSGDWWAPESAWQRFEWDIEMENRSLLRLVLHPPERWTLDGCY